MYTNSDIPSLAASYDLAVSYGQRHEAYEIAVDMTLVEEMENPEFIGDVMDRLAEDREVFKQLAEAWKSGGPVSFQRKFAKLFEFQARDHAAFITPDRID